MQKEYKTNEVKN